MRSDPYGIGCAQGVGGASKLTKLRYQINKRLPPQAETDTSTALNLFYTCSFD
ncbi:MAG: hypothetical protein ACOH2K_02255 [Burkholderiaceae bacterium]